MAGIAIGLDKYDEYGTDADGGICKNMWEWGQKQHGYETNVCHSSNL